MPHHTSPPWHCPPPSTPWRLILQGQGQGHHQSQQHQQHQQQPEATAARQGQHRSADMEKALALAAGAAAAAEPRYDPINPGESREKLEAIAQHMYGRTYGLLEVRGAAPDRHG